MTLTHPPDDSLEAAFDDMDGRITRNEHSEWKTHWRRQILDPVPEPDS